MRRIVVHMRKGDDQRGQLLLIVVVTLVFGMLMGTALISAVSGSLRSSGKSMRQEERSYSAAGAVEAVLADLVAGEDPLDPSYTPPSIDLNSVAPEVTVSTVDTTLTPRMRYRYVDVGAEGGLAALEPAGSFEVTLNGAQPYSILAVNWAFTSDGAGRVAATVRDEAGNVVKQASGSGSPLALVTRLTASEEYTVTFTNQGASNVDSLPYDSVGGRRATWMLTKAHGKEYRVAARTGSVELMTYIRQIPGPGPTSEQLRHTVVVETWKEQPVTTP